jgi:hypothetical protein
MRARQHALIHSAKDFGGSSRVMGDRAEGADEQRDGHGGGHTFAADIADGDECAAFRGRDDLVEVAADLARGLVDRVDLEPRDRRVLYGDKHLLDHSRGFDFVGETQFVAACAGKTKHDDSEHGDLGQKVREPAP